MTKKYVIYEESTLYNGFHDSQMLKMCTSLEEIRAAIGQFDAVCPVYEVEVINGKLDNPKFLNPLGEI